MLERILPPKHRSETQSGVSLSQPAPQRTRSILAGMVMVLLLSSCSYEPRGGMVEFENGLFIGSSVQNSIVVDPFLFSDRRLKVRTRNSSGDTAFDMPALQREVTGQLYTEGYLPADATGYGLLLDLNLVYSGQETDDRATEGALVGGVLGHELAADESPKGSAKIGGALLGAVIGDAVGRAASQDTYFSTVEVTLLVIDTKNSTNGERNIFNEYHSTVEVSAGGARTSQYEVAEAMRKRVTKILLEML